MIRCADCVHFVWGENLWDNECKKIIKVYKSPVSERFDTDGFESCQTVRVHGECGEDAKLFEAR